MKNIITVISLIAIGLLSGCGTGGSRYVRFYDEVIDGVTKANPGLTELSFYEFELTDSVTFKEEMDASKALFQKKKDRMTATAEQYRERKKKKNAAKWEAMAAHTDSVVVRIDSLFAGFESKDSEVLYYCCRFCGNGKGPNGKIVAFDNWYATVTPDGRVFNIVSDPTNLRQGMGAALAGYAEITSNEL